MSHASCVVLVYQDSSPGVECELQLLDATEAGPKTILLTHAGSSLSTSTRVAEKLVVDSRASVHAELEARIRCLAPQLLRNVANHEVDTIEA